MSKLNCFNLKLPRISLTTTPVLTPTTLSLYASIRYFSASKIRYTNGSEDNSEDKTSTTSGKPDPIEQKNIIADSIKEIAIVRSVIKEYKEQDKELRTVAYLAYKKDNGETLTEEEYKKLHNVVKAENFCNFDPSSYIQSVVKETEDNRDRIKHLQEEIDEHTAIIEQSSNKMAAVLDKEQLNYHENQLGHLKLDIELFIFYKNREKKEKALSELNKNQLPKKDDDDDDNGEGPSGTGVPSFSSKKPDLEDRSNEGGPSGNNTKDTLCSLVLFIWTAAVDIINAILDNLSHFL